MALSINDSSVKLAYKGPFYIDVLGYGGAFTPDVQTKTGNVQPAL